MPTLAAASLPARLRAGFAARFEAWTAPAPPPVAVEIAAAGVRAGRRAAAAAPESVARILQRELPPGLVNPSAVHPNLADPAAVAAALRSLLESCAALGAEVALLVPDLTARVAVLDFDTLPARREDLPPLARFRLRKSLPFPEDQAALSCQVIAPNRLLVAVADRARLDEYENCLEAAGARAATVLPSGLACLAALPALKHAALLLRRDGPSLATAFCWQERVEFFRVLEVSGGEAGFDDVFPSIAFYRDRLEQAGSLSDAALLLAGLAPALEARLREEISWAQVRSLDAPAELAVRGALLGQFV